MDKTMSISAKGMLMRLWFKGFQGKTGAVLLTVLMQTAKAVGERHPGERGEEGVEIGVHD